MPDPSSGIRPHAHVLSGSPHDYDALIDQLGAARLVLIGEATHGSREHLRERAHLTSRLIEEKGFGAVAVDADWPEASLVNRYVRGWGEDLQAAAALADFDRFPGWMWRNVEVLEFVGWLRAHNARRPDPVGFFGLDLYGMHRSITEAVRRLERMDPEGAHRARVRYACFDHTGEDPARFGFATPLDLAPASEDACIRRLSDLRAHRLEMAAAEARTADELFFVDQCARLGSDAEGYYRGMFARQAWTWNLREAHMMDTLDALAEHLGPHAKIVVWAHNAHVGDARAARLPDRGGTSMGELARRRHGPDACLVGCTTFAGSVTAAPHWGEPAEPMHLRCGRDDSWEGLLHRVDLPRFWLDLRRPLPALRGERLERGVGVVYFPGSERSSHYFPSRLAERFDALLHIDETSAVEPLEASATWTESMYSDDWPTVL